MLTLFDLTIGSTTYHYSDQPSAAFPDYAPRMNLYSELEEIPPDWISNRPAQTLGRVWLSNSKQDRYSTNHPTVSEIRAGGGTVYGAVARMRRYDTTSGTPVLVRDIYGIIEQVGDLAEDYTQLEIRADYLPMPDELLPSLKVRDLYPSADVDENLGVTVALGEAPKVILPNVSNHDAVVFTATAADETYEMTIEGFLAELVVKEGDLFVFEVAEMDTGRRAFSSLAFNARLDIGTATEWLSEVTDIEDENGEDFDADLGTPLLGRHIQRVFALPSTWVGETISRLRFLASPGHDAGFTGEFVYSVLKPRVIRPQEGQRLPYFDFRYTLTFTQVGDGIVTADRKDPQWLSRLWYPAEGADMHFSNGVPLEEGTVLDVQRTEELSSRGERIVLAELDNEAYQFLTSDEVTVQANMEEPTDTNPATLVEEMLANTSFGLSKTVVDTSIMAAETFYDGDQKVGGALTTQRQAGQVLRDLLLHGARLSYAAAGAVRLDVDELADHPFADIELGAGDRQWENFELGGIEINRDLPDGYRAYGLYDPGFPTLGETWGAYAQRGEEMGNILEQYFPYIMDIETLEREAHYRWRRIQQRATVVTGRIKTEAYGATALRQGERVYLNIPARVIDRETYEILGIERGQDYFDLTLAPWDADIFSFVFEAAVSQRSQALIDVGRSIPAQPVNVTAIATTNSIAVTADIDPVFGTPTHVVARVYDPDSITPLHTVSFPLDAIGLRDPTKDISLGTGAWRGGFSDGITAWAVDDTTNFLRAWTLATRARDTNRDINLGTGDWFGGLTDGTTAWVVEINATSLRAWTLATQTRDMTRDINLGTGTWTGGTTDGTTIWIVDRTNRFLRAWTLATRARDMNRDIDLGTTGDWRSTLTDGTTIWAVNDTDNYARAWNLATQMRDTDKDIDVSEGNHSLLGSFTDTMTGWFIDDADNQARAWQLQSPRTSRKIGVDLSLALSAGDYDVEVLLFSQENPPGALYSQGAFVRGVTVT